LRRKFYQEYSLSLASGAFILILFTLPGSFAEVLRPKARWLKFITSDPVVHAGAMALFALALSVDNRRVKKIVPWVKVVLISLGYGLALEIIQNFIPGRAFELRDLLFDGVGILVMLGALVLLFSWQKFALRAAGTNPPSSK